MATYPAAVDGSRRRRSTREFESQNFELNDTIKWKNWSFNVGVLVSQDTLYGQGLRRTPRRCPGSSLRRATSTRCTRSRSARCSSRALGATWAYNGKDTVYASYARYNPAASSLPRAASWDRNLTGTLRRRLLRPERRRCSAAGAVGSSSGKLFVAGHDAAHDRRVPGRHREAVQPQPVRRALYVRYREAATSGRTRTTTRASRSTRRPASRSELYIPDLSAQLAQIGSGSTYVIAELDGAYTKYYEVTLESEWRSDKTFVRGSYTWSHYYGNFDQDNSTTANDANIFIGSSYIGDGAGRQLWDFKDGTLRGDRPHMLKIYGYSPLPWNASVGAFGVAQSGQPWEKWSYEPYRALTTSPATRTATPSRPARAARRALPARPELHAEHPVRRAASTSRSRPTCSTSSTSRRATTSPPTSTARCSARPGTTSIRGACRSRRACSSSGAQSVAGRPGGQPPGRFLRARHGCHPPTPFSLHGAWQPGTASAGG